METWFGAHVGKLATSGDATGDELTGFVTVDVVMCVVLTEDLGSDSGDDGWDWQAATVARIATQSAVARDARPKLVGISDLRL